MFDSEELIAELHAQGGPALVAAVEKEFRTGWELQKHWAMQKEQSRSEVGHARSAAVDGLGYISSSIDSNSYFYWLNKGRNELGCQNVWAEDEFRRDYAKKNTQTVVKYQSAKPRSGWTPDMDASTGTAPAIVMGSKYGMGVTA
jgi:hypothetical protein